MIPVIVSLQNFETVYEVGLFREIKFNLNCVFCTLIYFCTLLYFYNFN